MTTVPVLAFRVFLQAPYSESANAHNSSGFVSCANSTIV
jgi:hypothetical protein